MNVSSFTHTLFEIPLHEFEDLLVHTCQCLCGPARRWSAEDVTHTRTQVELKAAHANLVGLMATIVDSAQKRSSEAKPTPAASPTPSGLSGLLAHMFSGGGKPHHAKRATAPAASAADPGPAFRRRPPALGLFSCATRGDCH
jgi:hypothetical protein